MAKRLSPTFVALVYEATLRSFWRKKTLSRFLRHGGIAASFLAGWTPDESKRDFLDRLFAKLPSVTKGPEIILAIARDLAYQESFPDLLGWEESERMLKDARQAVLALRRALDQLDDQVQTDRQRQAAQERFRTLQEEAQLSRSTLSNLENRLTELAGRLGTQQAGYEFQTWFYDLMDFFEIVNRRPYVSGGRQIDGSITVSGTTYLVELKFTRDQAAAPEIDSLHKKVTDKADNTMGIMISVSGYSAPAVKTASGPRTPLLLFDHGHLYLALTGSIAFDDIIDRVRRHASQTGDSYLTAASFGT
ncbi:MAG TPA: hypothetical protein VHB47_18840 [Thermoanaerobaculia bacterium]|jgi:hypothetical protein|nr:hypothetical protein [Thermoanaerobaculia bacterium]